jgi:hypothetical protein
MLTKPSAIDRIASSPLAARIRIGLVCLMAMGLTGFA